MLKKFVDSGRYIELIGVVDVITGINSDNTLVIEHLTQRLTGRMEEFAEKYLPSEYDPLINAVWPDNNKEEEQLWGPVQKAIDSGPAASTAIDKLRTSVFSEARTADQSVTYAKFLALEIEVFLAAHLLVDALKNSDDVDGKLKLSAYEAVLRSQMIAYQVGFMFAPMLAKMNIFRWGGVVFIGFDIYNNEDDSKEGHGIVDIVVSVNRSVAAKVSEEIGAHKLAPLFRARAMQSKEIGFIDVMNFCCVLSARGGDWVDVLTTLIEKCGKNAFYLHGMLNALMGKLTHEFLTTKDRSSLKRLVALIQTKRAFNKNNPGARIVDRVLQQLEKEDRFPAREGSKAGDA
jgi:hypothetical protein